MICPNCKKEISENSTGCIYCGITRVRIEELQSQQKVKLHKEKNKMPIIIFEIVVIIGIVALYCNLFLPRILEYTKIERENHQKELCIENYGGTWDEYNKKCNIEPK